VYYGDGSMLIYFESAKENRKEVFNGVEKLRISAAFVNRVRIVCLLKEGSTGPGL